MKFPTTAMENRALAKTVIDSLRAGIHNTHTQGEWTEQNFRVLRECMNAAAFDSFHAGHQEGKKRNEFLWDFTAFLNDGTEKGLLFALESEHSDLLRKPMEFHDFDKLIYARCPVKVMMFTVKSPKDFEEKQALLQAQLAKCCNCFSAADVFVLYGVYWREGKETENRDVVSSFQVKGEPAVTFDPAPMFTNVPTSSI